MLVDPGGALGSDSDRPRMAGRDSLATPGGLVVGEWSLTEASWTDRHAHEEVNHVLEGELHVTVDDVTQVIGVGGTVVVPSGSLATYAAPVHARMLFVYGPSADGHATADARYCELG